MKWTEVTVWTSEEAMDAVSEMLTRVGAAGVAIEDPNDLEQVRQNPFGNWYDAEDELVPPEGARVIGYFSELTDLQALLNEIRSELGRLPEYGLQPGKAEISTRETDEEDWANAWKQYFKPVRVTNRLTIKPTWESYDPSSTEAVIELDPGMAFGTGTHLTTVLSLRMLEKYLPENARVADVGCGTAILSIAAAKLGAKEVLAMDFDPVAVKVAEENVALNRVEDRVQVRQNDLLKGIKGPFSLVIANILADIIAPMISDAFRQLTADGVFITSGIIKEKAEFIRSELIQHGFEILEVQYKEDWTVIVGSKPSR